MIPTFRIQILDENCMPTKNHESDACFDVVARCFKDAPDEAEKPSKLLTPHSRVLVPLGFKLALEEGWEALIRPRSGLAIKQGITVANSPGTIDAEYRGECCAILQNNSTEIVVLEAGTRIAQMAIRKYDYVELIPQTEDLDSTDRGEKGFGSSGV